MPTITRTIQMSLPQFPPKVKPAFAFSFLSKKRTGTEVLTHLL